MARAGPFSGCSLFTARIFKQEFVRPSIYHGERRHSRLMHHNRLLSMKKAWSSNLLLLASVEYVDVLYVSPSSLVITILPHLKQLSSTLVLSLSDFFLFLK